MCFTTGVYVVSCRVDVAVTTKVEMSVLMRHILSAVHCLTHTCHFQLACVDLLVRCMVLLIRFYCHSDLELHQHIRASLCVIVGLRGEVTKTKIRIKTGKTKIKTTIANLFNGP